MVKKISPYAFFQTKRKAVRLQYQKAMLSPLIYRQHYHISHIIQLMKSRSSIISIIICALSFLSALSLQADIITCRTCGGSGSLHNGYTSRSMTCPTCSGSGREYSTPTSPYTSGGYIQCPTCSGHRSVRMNGYEQVCPQCGGAGEIASGSSTFPPIIPGGTYITVPGLPPIPVPPQPTSRNSGKTTVMPIIPAPSKSSAGEIGENILIAIGCTLGAICYIFLIIFFRQFNLNRTNHKPTDIQTLGKQTNDVISTYIGNVLNKIKERINKAKQPKADNQHNSQLPPFKLK